MTTPVMMSSYGARVADEVDSPQKNLFSTRGAEREWKRDYDADSLSASATTAAAP